MSVEHLGKWDRAINNIFNYLILRTINKTVIIWELELRKIRRDYTDLLIRAIQPVLWLTIFVIFNTRRSNNLAHNLSHLHYVISRIFVKMRWVYHQSQFA